MRLQLRCWFRAAVIRYDCSGKIYFKLVLSKAGKVVLGGSGRPVSSHAGLSRGHWNVLMTVDDFPFWCARLCVSSVFICHLRPMGVSWGYFSEWSNKTMLCVRYLGKQINSRLILTPGCWQSNRGKWNCWMASVGFRKMTRSRRRLEGTLERVGSIKGAVDYLKYKVQAIHR